MWHDIDLAYKSNIYWVVKLSKIKTLIFHITDSVWPENDPTESQQVQYWTVITWPISAKWSWKTPHSSPVRVSYAVSFVNFKVWFVCCQLIRCRSCHLHTCSYIYIYMQYYVIINHHISRHNFSLQARNITCGVERVFMGCNRNASWGYGVRVSKGLAHGLPYLSSTLYGLIHCVYCVVHWIVHSKECY